MACRIREPNNTGQRRRCPYGNGGNIVGTPFLASENTAASQKTDAQKRIPTLGQIVANYKAGVTREVRRLHNDPHLRLWQSRYHDHIIRDASDANRIQGDVLHHPSTWISDDLNDG